MFLPFVDAVSDQVDFFIIFLGPLLSDHLDIRNIPVDQMREITIDLSG